MLDNNQDLEYLCVGLYRESQEYVEWFRKYYQQPINRSIKLDVESKIALMSVGCQLGDKRMNWEVPVMRKTHLTVRYS
ncbi:hypothetical protein P3T76_002771 [Phytophthora citrophthora]|nr:hypothetical protein P3T76_002771 [Phytophthora citrophthora]